jgi:hypothetical protein
MTQEQLAKKWAENYEADVAVCVYDAIFAALQEQETLHPWADAEERYKQVLDDFQKVADVRDTLAFDQGTIRALVEERDTFKAAWEALADVAKKAVEDMAAERIKRKEAEAQLTSHPAPSGWQPIASYDLKKHGERILTPRGIAWQSSYGYWNCEGDAEAFTYGGPKHFMPLPPDPPKEPTS